MFQTTETRWTSVLIVDIPLYLSVYLAISFIHQLFDTVQFGSDPYMLIV